VVLPARSLPRLGLVALLGLGGVALLAGCPPDDAVACFPAASATPPDESEGGFSATTLRWEIDKMAALVGVPESNTPPSEVFLRAQRDMHTEFWTDAAKNLLSVIRGDTPDGKTVRLVAQYDFAIALYRLRYFEEAKHVFQMITDNHDHPRRSDAQAWVDRKVCPG
jgi:hypothetical protein